MNSFELEARLIDFASRIMDMAEHLPPSPGGKFLGGQIIRSGISSALNYGEAQGAESREDFVHKMKVCQKELRETMINLKIIQKRKFFTEDKLADLIQENNQLISIFVASTRTAQTKNRFKT